MFKYFEDIFDSKIYFCDVTQFANTTWKSEYRKNFKEVKSRITRISEIGNQEDTSYTIKNDERLEMKTLVQFDCKVKRKRRFNVCRKCSRPICLEQCTKICSTCLERYRDSFLCFCWKFLLSFRIRYLVFLTTL